MFNQTRSNFFKINDFVAFKNLCEQVNKKSVLINNDTPAIVAAGEGLSIYHKGDKFQIGCHDRIKTLVDNDGKSLNVDLFYEELQKLIPYGEACIINEIGELDGDLIAYYCIITAEDICWNCLNQLSEKEAQDMLNNPGYRSGLYI